MSKKNRKILIAAIISFVFLISLPVVSYKVMTLPVSNQESSQLFEIKSGTTANQVLQDLEDANLIKSSFFAQVSMRLNNLSDFKSGVFSIPSNGSTLEVLTLLNSAPVSDTVNVTIPEGFWAEQIAKSFADATNVTEQEFLDLWQDEEFLSEIIQDYDFLDERILSPDKRYGVEGFLFPNTYNVFTETSTARNITLMMLNEMERQLEPYLDTIDSLGWDVFDLVTFASIIEYEARTHEDRIMVAGVFLNRMEVGMRFESCATVSYALNEHLFRVSAEQANTASPYNTYMVDGLPVGPVMNPSISSITASIEAIQNKNSGNGHDYLFFMSDIQNTQQTFFARTYEEHMMNVEKFLD